MQAQFSTISSSWNKKETNQLEGILRKSFPALMNERGSWEIEDVQAHGVNGPDIYKENSSVK